MSVTAADVKALRDRTGAAMMDCKSALAESDGDVDRAIEILRVKGQASAAKREGRGTEEGVVASYIHANDKVGAMVEVQCETDFVARTDDFKDLVRNLAMQVAATNAQAVDRSGVDPGMIERERAILMDQARQSGKPENILAKIVDGKIDKYYEEITLLEQPYIKDPDRKVKELVDQAIAKLGENIVVRRFTKFRIGEA